MTNLTLHTDPPVSEAQRRAMYAAASGKSNLGIPQSVGKEFLKGDMSAEEARIKAVSGKSIIGEPDSPVKSDEQDFSEGKAVKTAGICYVAGDGTFLLLKRGMGGDHPGEWAFPGGHLDDDESAVEAAIREFQEETGHVSPTPELMGQWGKFAAFGTLGPKFDVKLSDESLDYVWCPINDLPEPMHPRCLAILNSPAFARIGLNEYGIACAMATGGLSSPQIYRNVALFDIRITGTGVSYRSANQEFTWRAPSDYLTPEFVQRCNGLPVIMEHPDQGVLDSEEFKNRIIGTVLYPYIKGDEVWGIAKIYDDAAAQMMCETQLSTSPSVITKGDSKLVLADGSECLVEGTPIVLDHIAICEVGVWDKGGNPVGVNSNQAGASIMTEEEIKAKADAEAKEKEEAQAKADALHETLGKLTDALEGLHARMDAMEGKKADGEPAPIMTDAKKDADEEAAKKEKEEKEQHKADKAKADAALRDEIAAMKAKLPGALSDAQMNELSDAQAKADSVLSAFGESAPRPIAGETPLAYRRRIAAKLKMHSKKWANEDLSMLSDSVLGIAEEAIYADAFAASNTPAVVGKGSLRQHTRRTPGGHTVIEWRGDPDAYMAGFAAQPQRLIGINKNVH